MPATATPTASPLQRTALALAEVALENAIQARNASRTLQPASRRRAERQIMRHFARSHQRHLRIAASLD